MNNVINLEVNPTYREILGNIVIVESPDLKIYKLVFLKNNEHTCVVLEHKTKGFIAQAYLDKEENRNIIPVSMKNGTINFEMDKITAQTDIFKFLMNEFPKVEKCFPLWSRKYADRTVLLKAFEVFLKLKIDGTIDKIVSENKLGVE